MENNNQNIPFFGKIKSVIGFNNKKTFASAIGFYLFYLMFCLVAVFIIQSILFIFIFPNSINDSNLASSSALATKLLSITFLLIIAFLVIKGRKLGFKMGYLSLILIGALVAYLFTPLFAFVFPAYMTTLGPGSQETATTII